MAIFKSNLMSDIRGSLNGTTFSRTKAGAIMRNRTNPVQPNTAYQAAQRAFMTQAADAYKNLSSVEIEEWADAVALSGFTMQNALGDSYVPSAKQVFTLCKMNLLGIGDINAPDVSKFIADPNLPDITVGTVTLDTLTGTPATLQEFSVEVGSTRAGAFAEFMVTLPTLPSLRNYKKFLRKIFSEATGTIITPTIHLLEVPYNARFTGIDYNDQTGNVIGLAVRTVDPAAGLASAWNYAGQFTLPAPAV